MMRTRIPLSLQAPPSHRSPHLLRIQAPSAIAPPRPPPPNPSSSHMELRRSESVPTPPKCHDKPEVLLGKYQLGRARFEKRRRKKKKTVRARFEKRRRKRSKFWIRMTPSKITTMETKEVTSVALPMTESSLMEMEPLIFRLPDEVAEQCHLHLPFPYRALIRSVSTWNQALSSSAFLRAKLELYALRPPR